MADPARPQGAAGGDPPQLTLLNLFPTPLVIATMPDAAALNTEFKRMILAREAASESVQRSNTFPGPDGAALGEAQRLTPHAGMLVVFPSWLSHGVCPIAARASASRSPSTSA
jgi:hypothetical protein